VAGGGGVGVFGRLCPNCMAGVRFFNVGNPTIGITVEVRTHVSEDNVWHMWLGVYPCECDSLLVMSPGEVSGKSLYISLVSLSDQGVAIRGGPTVSIESTSGSSGVPERVQFHLGTRRVPSSSPNMPAWGMLIDWLNGGRELSSWDCHSVEGQEVLLGRSWRWWWLGVFCSEFPWSPR